jgi:hypothetical protein
MPEKPSNREPDLAAERISRRRMLKRIGAGAAVAWSAPILTSLQTPAFAQQRYCTQCAGDFCFGQTVCGTTPPLGCPCAQPVGEEGTGVCFCYQDDFCANRTLCASSADCPAGETCVHSCCDAAVGSAVCFAPCGEPTGPQTASSGQSGYNW